MQHKEDRSGPSFVSIGNDLIRINTIVRIRTDPVNQRVSVFCEPKSPGAGGPEVIEYHGISAQDIERLHKTLAVSYVSSVRFRASEGSSFGPSASFGPGIAPSASFGPGIAPKPLFGASTFGGTEDSKPSIWVPSLKDMHAVSQRLKKTTKSIFGTRSSGPRKSPIVLLDDTESSTENPGS